MSTKASTIGSLLVSMIVSLSLLPSCAPVSDLQAPETSSVRPEILTSAQNLSLGDASCPSQPNIRSNYDWNLDQSLNFSSCKKTTDLFSIAIFPVNDTSVGSHCVFPVQYVDGDRFVYKIGNNGLPMVTCRDIPRSGLEMSFPYTIFNALVVVRSSDGPAMSTCLINGSGCPAQYSLGRL